MADRLEPNMNTKNELLVIRNVYSGKKIICDPSVVHALPIVSNNLWSYPMLERDERLLHTVFKPLHLSLPLKSLELILGKFLLTKSVNVFW